MNFIGSHDANEDGQISKEELMTAAFNAVDTSGDGKISEGEGRAAMNELGVDADTQQAVIDHVAQSDANGDGLISKDEAANAM